MRIRPSTVAIAFAVALVFSGLWLALGSLAGTERASRAADARQVAVVVETFLAVRAAELRALHAPFLDAGGRPDVRRLAVVATELRPTPFRRVWVTDAAGALLYGGYVASGAVTAAALDSAVADMGAAVDTGRATPTAATAALLRAVSATGRAAVLGAPDGDSAVVIAEPVVVDGTVLGVVAGSVPLATLRALVFADAAMARRRGLLLLAGDPAGRTMGQDTVLAHPPPRRGGLALGGRAERFPQTIALPGGDRWYLELSYPRVSSVRLELWGVALAALGALVVGAWHERRQSRRIADRSRELEHLSEELLQANKAKSEFLANVSHELRTPLNAVVGFAELLRDGVYGELTPRQSGPVARIEASATHLRQLVDQVLDLAKITAGRLEVQPEIVDLRQMALDVGTEMEPLFAERGLAFSIAVGAAVPRLRTDPAHLRQILVNLLGNAVKFTDAGGVTVRTRLLAPLGAGATTANASGNAQEALLRRAAPDHARSWVLLQVTDTGLGIATADQARIFDEFEQVNPGSRGDSDRRGTGLGLPISRRLARLLGGDLTVDSAPSRGSTFTLWLPV